MGCAASLSAIGLYHPDIKDYLMYPADQYGECRLPFRVQCHVCNVVTTDSSRMLAEALGFELWNFTGHIFEIAPGLIFETINEELLETALEGSEYDAQLVIVAILKLAHHKFTFIFEPNG